MSAVTNNVFMSVLAAVTVACAAAAADPARASSASLGEFTAATCVDTIDDLTKVDALARDNNWSADANPGQFASSWTLAQDDTKVMVGTATRRNQDLCSVAFPESNRPQRDEFMQALFGSMTTTEIGTMTVPAPPGSMQGARVEMFRLGTDGTNRIVLEVMSYDDGAVLMVGVVKSR
jgi:hypothetical protein